MIRTRLRGIDLLRDPRLNKGTAFTEAERDRFGLHGLLPPHVGTLEDQVTRRRGRLANIESDFRRYRFLRDLQDSNETLFYALLQDDLESLLPIVYTPAVGEGCQRFSEIWHLPRGLFLGYPNRDRIAQILADPRYDAVRCIVVSDGERILGLGDQGIGGMGIPIGKLALYTALGGIAPEQCLPVLLDVGTDNAERLDDPLYMGWRHERVRGDEYDGFIETFVSAVRERWPHVLLQWEDFAGRNAARLLARYRDRLCTFNDDIQGTAAAATGALLAASAASGTPLERQHIVIVGAGSAGLGIANMLVAQMERAGLTATEARDRIWAVDRHGLLRMEDPELTEEQRPFARRGEHRELIDVIREARAGILIGVSGQAGAFTEVAVRAMAEHAPRPIIFALSNPTSRSEATAQQLAAWTDGRAIIATGSPFPGVAQVNNAYIFPGLALGTLAAEAERVSEGMIAAAAAALADLSPLRRNPSGGLLPPIRELRDVSRVVASAVAKAAIADGQSGLGMALVEPAIGALVWEPVYEPYEAIAG